MRKILAIWAAKLASIAGEISGKEIVLDSRSDSAQDLPRPYSEIKGRDKQGRYRHLRNQRKDDDE